MIGLYFVGLVISVFVLYLLLKLNRLAYYKKRVIQGWEGVEILLNKRYELFDVLAQEINKLTTFEPAFEKELTRNRITAIHAFTVSEHQKAEHELLESVKKLLDFLHDNSGIQEESIVRETMKDLTTLGVSIRNAIHYYNGTVREYNKRRQKFPSEILARLMDYGEIKFFASESLNIPEEEGVGV